MDLACFLTLPVLSGRLSAGLPSLSFLILTPNEGPLSISGKVLVEPFFLSFLSLSLPLSFSDFLFLGGVLVEEEEDEDAKEEEETFFSSGSEKKCDCDSWLN